LGRATRKLQGGGPKDIRNDKNSTIIMNPRPQKLTDHLNLWITPEIKLKLEQIQKHENRSTMADTVRALLTKIIKTL
jgi:hypothetical protein